MQRKFLPGHTGGTGEISSWGLLVGTWLQTDLLANTHCKQQHSSRGSACCCREGIKVREDIKQPAVTRSCPSCPLTGTPAREVQTHAFYLI